MLQVVDLYRSFEGKPLLKGVSFNIGSSEIVCLLGASGSGKSTILRLIAGLETPEKGGILWDGNDIANTPTHKRDFSLMFQDYALFPHLNVRENIEYGMRRRNWTKEKINASVEKLAKFLGLAELLGRGISDLSGGEQQRVALARALAIEPRLLMLDEPLGALDRKLKEDLLDQLRAILKETELPAIYVTHDQAEAFAIADRIILLNDGRIAQDASPREIYDHPNSAWVAEFMGLGTTVRAVRTLAGWDTAIGRFPLEMIESDKDQCQILIRPNVHLDPDGPIKGTVTDVVFKGEIFIVELDNDRKYQLKTIVKPGAIIQVSPDRVTVLPDISL